MKRKVSGSTRLLHDLFTQYPSTFLALCELLNNSIQADAKNIYLSIDYTGANELYPIAIKSILVKDDGIGVHVNHIQDTLLDFGDSSKKGGKGIGRFAALQIGSDVIIETIGYNQQNKTFSKVCIPFSEQYIKSVKKIEDLVIETDEQEKLSGKHKTYYQIAIQNLYDPATTGKSNKRKISEKLLKDNINNSLFERYATLIYNKAVKFHINGKYLNPDDFIVNEPYQIKTKFIDKKGNEHPLFFTYVQLKSSLDEIKVFLTTKNAGVDTVVSGFAYNADWLSPKMQDWFVYIHSDNLDTDLYRNLELENLDDNIQNFKSFIKDKLNDFFKEKNKEYDDFVAKLKNDTYYPYKNGANVTSKSKVAFFDKVAYLVEERHNLFKESKHLREIIYPLIDRTISTGDLDGILKKILGLNKKYMKKFDALLERAEIEDVIEFSEKVAKKTDDLALLEKLTCSELSKHILERKELHKVLEKMLWVFGEKYLENTTLLSDTSLEANLKKLREENLVFKQEKDKSNLDEDIKGLSKSITDLFLYSELPLTDTKREVLIVELKAPKVKISTTELNQAKKYAREIENSTFYSEDIDYNIILISTKLSDAGKYEFENVTKPRDNPYLYFTNNKNITISVLRWGQIIEQNKRKLKYLSNRLQVKDRTVEEKIQSDFEEIKFDKVKSVLRTVPINERP